MQVALAGLMLRSLQMATRLRHAFDPSAGYAAGATLVQHAHTVATLRRRLWPRCAAGYGHAAPQARGGPCTQQGGTALGTLPLQPGPPSVQRGVSPPTGPWERGPCSM